MVTVRNGPWDLNSRTDAGNHPTTRLPRSRFPNCPAASLYDALTDADYQLNFTGLPAPDTVVLYVVPDAGGSEETHGLGELTHLTKGDTVVPVVLRGLIKYGPTYTALLSGGEDRPLYARHEVSVDGWVSGEVSEVYDTAGQVVLRKVVGGLYGRGTPVGRVVETDSAGPVVQYYVKNHLGSTVRVVNADGEYAATPTFDYQPYGELQGIREDSANPVSAKYTGKPLDTEVNLYYFGARWYDQELGMWIGPDPARNGINPYGYVDGNPVIFIDSNGLIKVGLGISVGWTRKGGFSLGTGVGIEDLELPGLTICADWVMT